VTPFLDIEDQLTIIVGYQVSLMKREERIKEITDGLSLLVRSARGEDSYVIFENPKTMKFIQFSPSSKGILCDVPLIELSREEEIGVRRIIGEEAAADHKTGELISYQRVFESDEIEQASEMLERIFIEAFKLTESYELKTEKSI
jgi:hypothetical protein